MSFDPTVYECKYYSQFEEDGILLELVRRIDPSRKIFVEIGAGAGSENCTRVLLDHDWCGEWYDRTPADCLAAAAAFEAAKDRLRITCEKITVENVRKHLLVPARFGVLSIDVDGNDYWLWHQICGAPYPFRPDIVVIEAQIQKPHDEPYVMPYDPDYEWDNVSHDCGASVFSMIELGMAMGYHYVGKCSSPHSPNLFFVAREHVEKLQRSSVLRRFIA